MCFIIIIILNYILKIVSILLLAATWSNWERRYVTRHKDLGQLTGTNKHTGGNLNVIPCY